MSRAAWDILAARLIAASRQSASLILPPQAVPVAFLFLPRLRGGGWITWANGRTVSAGASAILPPVRGFSLFAVWVGYFCWSTFLARQGGGRVFGIVQKRPVRAPEAERRASPQRGRSNQVSSASADHADTMK